MAVKEKKMIYCNVEPDFCEKIEKSMMGLIDLLEIHMAEYPILYHLGLDNVNGFYNYFVQYLNVYLQDYDEKALIRLSEKVYTAILGLKELLKMMFEESDIMYQIGMDNLKVLKQNFVKFTNYFF